MSTSPQSHFPFTQRNIKELPFATDGKSYRRRDSKQPCLGVYVGKNVKTYFVEARGKLGNKHRAVIGPCHLYSPETARAEARKWLLTIYEGKNPSRRVSGQVSDLTLERVFNEYIADHALSKVTVADYKVILNRDLAAWRGTLIWRLTTEVISTQYTTLGEASHARANLAMRLLRALFNYAAAKYEGHEHIDRIMANPVSRLFRMRSWFRVNRRQSVIKTHQLGAWLDVTTRLSEQMTDSVVPDFLLTLLFTGLRRAECTELKKTDIDFASRTFVLKGTKNHEPHSLPIPSVLLRIFERRCQRSPNEFVFPGEGGTRHIVEPRKTMIRITLASGVPFTLHDLRRTFITVAEGLDIPAYALKRLLNHKMKGDVTAGYIIHDPERLREPMERIAACMLNASGTPNHG